MMLALAVGSLAAGCVGGEYSEEMTATEEDYSSSSWTCKNAVSAVTCNGFIALLPVSVDVKNVRLLNDVELNVLEDSLDNLSILSGNDITIQKILNNTEVTVLEDFLNKFNINVTKNDITVCVLSLLTKCQ
jgi:hypothetical protein